MASRFGSVAGSPGYSERDLKAMSTEDQVELMVDWFNRQFEDPQNETPRDNEAGRYVYPWGDPLMPTTKSKVSSQKQ